MTPLRRKGWGRAERGRGGTAGLNNVTIKNSKGWGERFCLDYTNALFHHMQPLKEQTEVANETRCPTLVTNS